jgi:hypothetical protein
LSFLSIYKQAFYQPGRAFLTLLSDHRYFRFGFLYMLIPIAGYTLVYIFLAKGGAAPSAFSPWLNIPAENYYDINRYLLAPAMVLSWFTAASLMQVLSRLWTGEGRFEQTLALTGLSISVAMWGSLIHDLPVSLLGAIHLIDARQHETDMNNPTFWRTLLWISYTIYTVAFFILFIKVSRVLFRLGLATSILIGSLGFVFFQLIFFTFNR